MKTLMVVAAGLGTRMGGLSVPKALAKVNGKPNIEYVIQHGVIYDRIVVIANVKAKEAWVDWQNNCALGRAVELAFIDSGLGDGHAVLNGLKEVNRFYPSKIITIMWGDVHINNSEIFAELEAQDLGDSLGIFPVSMEQNPYVTALVDEKMNVTHIDFSKRGECHANGFHDQSIFKFKTAELIDALTNLHNVFWKGGRYIAEGGELNFLHVMHYLNNTGRAVKIYQTEYPLMSYNTPDELKRIQA